MARFRLARLLPALALLPVLGSTAPAEPSAEGGAPERTRAGPGARRAVPSAPQGGETLLGRDADATRVDLEIEHPADGSVTGEKVGAYVAGRAAAYVGEAPRFDVVFVIDTSSSAKQMTGADVNGNGVVGVRGPFGDTDPGDSILAVEVAAAKRLLRGLDPRRTRVALVTFAGDPPGRGGALFGGAGRESALTEEPLTRDFARIERGLDRVLERGADGLTDMAAGLDRARVELTGGAGAGAEPDPESAKAVLFFTDGQPTLSRGGAFDVENIRAVLRAAERLREAGVRVHSFAVGDEALEGPVATLEAAARTGGYFTPVRQPGDLVAAVQGVSLVELDAIRVRNATTGEEATSLLANADGSFGALVPLAPGRNQIEVVARATDGSEARRSLSVHHAPDAPGGAELLRELVPQRTELLEQRLLELRRERAERTRKQLELEIERERARARRRAARQRKELDLEVEHAVDAGGGS